jgi:hypothetical protein
MSALFNAQIPDQIVGGAPSLFFEKIEIGIHHRVDNFFGGFRCVCGDADSHDFRVSDVGDVELSRQPISFVASMFEDNRQSGNVRDL